MFVIWLLTVLLFSLELRFIYVELKRLKKNRGLHAYIQQASTCTSISQKVSLLTQRQHISKLIRRYNFGKAVTADAVY